MKLSTIPKRPTIWDTLALHHVEQANECIRIAKIYEARGDEKSVTFWQRVWKEKQQDAENVRMWGAEL